MRLILAANSGDLRDLNVEENFAQLSTGKKYRGE
jgi:hypothetical protein